MRHQRVYVLVVAEHRPLAGWHNVHQSSGGVQIVRRCARAVLVAQPLRLLLLMLLLLLMIAAARRDDGVTAAAASQLRTATNRCHTAAQPGRRGVGRRASRSDAGLTVAEQKRTSLAEAETRPAGVRSANFALWRPLHGLVAFDLATLFQRVELLRACMC